MSNQLTIAEWDALLTKVENRDFSRCDTLSGETVSAVTIKSESTAVIVFQRNCTNKPHIRTVILARENVDQKWRVRAENTVSLDAERPSTVAPVISTSNTRETVQSVTPSATLSGRQVDAIDHIFQQWENGIKADECLELLKRELGIR